MTLPLSLNALIAKDQGNLEPILSFIIDGIPYTFSAGTILEYFTIGEAGLKIGSYNGAMWQIGGAHTIDGMKDYISMSGGTTTKVNQQLQPDKGLGSSVTQMTIALVDKDQEVSEMISPSFVVPEILGKECKVQLGFAGTVYPDDYVTIFRGVIEDVVSGAGLITFSLSSSEQKKRAAIFNKATAVLDANIASSGSISTITVDDATPFMTRQLGPDGAYDSNQTLYVKIGDEYFSYTGTTGTTLTGVTRNPAPFDFGMQAHSIGDDVASMVRLQGNGLELARKIMFSGGGYFSTSVAIENFVRISGSETVANSIFFLGVDVQDTYGIEIGDYITTTGASNGANNVTLKQIDYIEKTLTGSYITVTGVTFVEENDTAGTVSFRSRWDTLADGCAMKGFDVDDAEFEYLYNTFLSSFDFDFRLFDTITAKDFIEQQIFRPMGCFSVPRKGRVSVGFHIGPIPNSDILILNEDNILAPASIKIRRSLSKNFYNAVIYNLEKDVNTGKYAITKTTTDPTSIDDFNVGQRTIIINSDGMTDANQGVAKALQTSTRLLNRYKRGAEYLENVQVKFGDGYTAEVGDIIILDTENLSITNITTGDRSSAIRIFQILNKSIDLKGGITLNLVDTAFSNASRYGLISPSSIVKSGSSTTVFVVDSSYNSKYGANEYLKWKKYGACSVRIRNGSGSISGISTISSWSGNTVTLTTALSFTPSAGMIMELSVYNNQADDIKFVYAFMRDTSPFDDGKDQYLQL